MLVLVNILLIITAIVLIIVFSLLLIPIEDIRKRLETKADQNLEDARRLLIIAATLDLTGFVLVMAIIVFAYRSAKTRCENPVEAKIQVDLYYRQLSTRFGIFLVLIASIVAALLADQAKRKVEASNEPVDVKNTISKHIQTGIGINWAISIKLILTFIFTFLGPKSEVLKRDLAEERLKQEIKKSTIQLTPIIQYPSCNSGPASAIVIPGYRLPVNNAKYPVLTTVSGTGQIAPVIVSRQTIS